jgi:hypothetical protein
MALIKWLEGCLFSPYSYILGFDLAVNNIDKEGNVATL